MSPLLNKAIQDTIKRSQRKYCRLWYVHTQRFYEVRKQAWIMPLGIFTGCLDKLRRLLDHIRYDPSRDRLLFVGDYIDRGPESKGVLDLLLQLQRENAANVFLMGNHEDNFLTYIRACLHNDKATDWQGEPFFAGGGVATLHSYHANLRNPYDTRVVTAIPQEHIQFMLHLPLWWTDDTYILVHAGVRPASRSPCNTPIISCVFGGPFCVFRMNWASAWCLATPPLSTSSANRTKLALIRVPATMTKGMVNLLPCACKPNRPSKLYEA